MPRSVLSYLICSHLHKNTNQTVDYMALGLMSFMWGLDITWAIGRVGLKVSPVLGPNRTCCRSCDFRAQNRLNFQPNPSNGPRNVNAPHKTHKAPRHIINSLINSYYIYITERMLNWVCTKSVEGSSPSKKCFCCYQFDQICTYIIKVK